MWPVVINDYICGHSLFKEKAILPTAVITNSWYKVVLDKYVTMANSTFAGDAIS